jgi:hypothetical protein
MRTAILALSALFAAAAGCGGVEASPSEAPHRSELADRSDPATVCPLICGVDTPCQTPDGTCTLACNPCLCREQGGTVVDSCPAPSGSDSPSDGAPSAAPPTGDDPAEEACGNTVCGSAEFCCNVSCGICAPVGGVCTQQFCN